MNTQQALKTGQIWTNAHRSNDGRKTTTGGKVVYYRLDAVIVSVHDNRTEACVNLTDVTDGTSVQLEIDDLYERYTLLPEWTPL